MIVNLVFGLFFDLNLWGTNKPIDLYQPVIVVSHCSDTKIAQLFSDDNTIKASCS